MIFVMQKIFVVIAVLIARMGIASFVTCDFQGQLGNQMFQVAAAVAYALDHQYEARFPDLGNAKDGPANCQFVFHRLNTSPFPGFTKFEIYSEELATHHTKYAPFPSEEGQNLRLNGFFQTDRYFAHHAEEIRRLFAPTRDILKKIYGEYGRLLKGNSVAVHVRTFLPDQRRPGQADFCGGADWSYYMWAIRQFSKDSIFLVFSDAIDWVERHFPKTSRTIYFIRDNPHYINLYTMSLCKHQVVSPESTFSWWAAWLNSNPNKKVICPSTWGGRDDAETCPESWIRLPIR